MTEQELIARLRWKAGAYAKEAATLAEIKGESHE